MASESCEIMEFVQCIEENIDVLTRSQKKEQKQKKTEAAETIITKWKNLKGQVLNHSSLLKKINNLKSRAKIAQNSGKPMSDWQTKILQIGSANSGMTTACDEADELLSDTEAQHPDKEESVADQIIASYETDETAPLSDHQLKRLVLLKQVKLLTLQQQRLERQVVAVKDVEFDFVGFE